jgi:hypothetical protein
MCSMHMLAINSHFLVIWTHIVAVVGILLEVFLSTQGQLVDTRPIQVVVGVHDSPTIVVVKSSIS